MKWRYLGQIWAYDKNNKKKNSKKISILILKFEFWNFLYVKNFFEFSPRNPKRYAKIFFQFCSRYPPFLATL